MKTFSEGTEIGTKHRVRTFSATLVALSLLLSTHLQTVSAAQNAGNGSEVKMIAFGWIPFKGDKNKPADTTQQHALYQLQPSKTSAPAGQGSAASSGKTSPSGTTTSRTAGNSGNKFADYSEPQPQSSPAPLPTSATTPTSSPAPQSAGPTPAGQASLTPDASGQPTVGQPAQTQSISNPPQDSTAQPATVKQVQTTIDTQSSQTSVPPNSTAPIQNAAQPVPSTSTVPQVSEPNPRPLETTQPEASIQSAPVAQPVQTQSLPQPITQIAVPQQQQQQQPPPPAQTETQTPAPTQFQVQNSSAGNASRGTEGYVTRQWQQPIGSVADAALISVLNDISRVLKDPAELAKIEDVNQRAVLSVARQVLAKALQKPGLVSDRIVHNGGKNATAMSTEAWSSGEVKLSQQSRGSLTAVWAKHENGLLQVTLAGECNDRLAPNGAKIGEFVVALSAKSPIDKGLDIQTQSEVRYWLGRISSISVESSCLNAATAGAPSSISPQPDTNITNKVVSSNSATASASGTDNEKTDGFYRREPLVLQPVVTQRGRQYMIDSPSPDQAPNGGSPPTATTDDAAQVSTNAESSAVEAELSAGPPAEIKQPSAGAFMILPDRVIAGQKMTASLVNASLAPESAVEITFNGTPRYTDKRGQALYAVREDADPGRSLNIVMTARPTDSLAQIEVIQPLSHPTQQFAPKMDSIEMTATTGMAMIDGHNFDGAAMLNHVVFDGQNEARVLAASPVQLKILVPASVQQGVHNISIAVGTMRSTPIAFKIVSTGAHRTAAR